MHALFCALWFLFAAAQALSLPGYKFFDLDLTWQDNAPVGHARKMMLINGQSPGPVLRIDQDDWVTVRVRNLSPTNTSLHFHGVEMFGTPWSDGVPGVTQNAIAPGQVFTHRFRATQAGSYWYHSHIDDQIEDGLYGAVVIRPRPHDPKPFSKISADRYAIQAMEAAERNVKPLTIYDYMHITSKEKWQITPAAGIELPCYDAILFNGKGRIQCLPMDEMMSHLGPVQKADLALVPGSTLTDKGCFPPEVMAAFGGNIQSFNKSAIPDGLFSGCVPTYGELETFHTRYSPYQEHWVAMDIIGATNFAIGVFSIDEHDMWVYAMDGSYIEPQKVQTMTLANGERYSIMVKTHRAGQFKMRYAANSAPQTITGHAILHVHGANPSSLQASQPWTDIIGTKFTNTTCFDQDVAHPFPPEPIPESADDLFVLNMRIDGASYIWALNSTRLEPHAMESRKTPMLFAPDTTANNVTIMTRNGTWVDLILFSSVFPMPPHPIHKHGVKMYQIGAGPGPFKWKSVDEARKEIPDAFNLANPPKRDTFTSHPARKEVNWIAVRYFVNNMGSWLLHCHISNHMVGGMAMVILDGVDAWSDMDIPQEYYRALGEH
ncbi:hypothetical protein VHEMI09868 [[Torrubiella] hemipterigena]|uniref:Multicopper oxidase n=1 Tax=[Torrubiella] hemipterigena TaxID=1531966 RepID=A0A0A1THD0_9HYPO|nr:hypothetical protein VHEMI09868 [[Torrubiella] hemipterigena]